MGKWLASVCVHLIVVGKVFKLLIKPEVFKIALYKSKQLDRRKHVENIFGAEYKIIIAIIIMCIQSYDI